MNKVITSVSLVAISSLLLAGCTKSNTPVTQSQNQTVSEAAEFAKAVESGKPTICSMTKGEDKMEYQIKGKKMRMSTATTMAGEDGKPVVTVGHMINDATYLYIWDDKTKQGSKMAIPTEEETKKMEEDAKKYQAQIPKSPKLESEADFKGLTDEGYTVSCKSQSVDDSVFSPPEGIKFIDPTEMMKAIPSPDARGNFDVSKLEELQKQYGGANQEDQ